MNGYLEIILGPMYAGKTTELIKTYKSNNPEESIVFNWVKEVNENNETQVISHDNVRISCVQSKTLLDMMYRCQSKKYIFINEAQFYDDLTKVPLPVVP